MRIIVNVIVFYFVIVFFVSRLVVPNFGFIKSPLPKIPKEIKEEVRRIEKKSKNKQDFLKNAHTFIIKNYYITRGLTILRIDKAFWTDITKIWREKGYLPCHLQNLILRAMLVESKYFKDSDVKLQVIMFDFFIHQKMRVKVNGKWIPVDPSMSRLGVKFGEETPWFG